ncbi:uncharacterized protein LOC18431026 [Amborella trichopoda]|uniref:uncharacterized protein LOC18431026 n=1 Tax=Amborella trichopoda TaxID=13333 RepID=UPI0005D431B1|nr:uncharacterized protein LOC18431026 [Amborella trichopoda]|eukprot:XP_011622182.1 uncharacterized protein LOC18431026 [Amborella trichopoda]
MYTEGRNGLKWASEGSVHDPILNMRNGVRNFGLPPSKLRSAYMSAPQVMPGDESGFGTESQYSTDSEEYIYGGRYSLDSSPQEEIRVFNRKPSNGSAQRYNTPVSMQQQYSSDRLYSDYSSSRETLMPNSSGTVQNGPVFVSEKPGLRGVRYPNGECADYVEDESSDSAGSSEVTQRESKHFPHGRRDEGFISEEIEARTLRQNKLSEDIPSAPPFNGSGKENNHAVHQKPLNTASTAPNAADAARSARADPTLDKDLGHGVSAHDNKATELPNQCTRPASVVSGEAVGSSIGPLPVRAPTFHVSGQGPWQAVIAYDACVRLCLHSWARGCMEAPVFLENECALLRNAFGLQQILLQPEEELLATRAKDILPEGAAPKPKKTIGRMKVQVRKVKMMLDMPSGCSFSSLGPSKIKLDSLKSRMSNFQSTVSAGWDAVKRVRVIPRTPAHATFSRHSLAYVQASTQYIKQVSSLLKTGVTTLRNSSSYEVVQETYYCLLRMKSSPEGEAFRMQPGSGESHFFLPDSLGDDLIVEVLDSKGNIHGRVLAQVATIAEDPNEKLRWWSIYHEPEHELVGRLQLYINYTTTPDDLNSLKCGPVAETVAYDLVLEVALKVQHFQQRNLVLHGSWRWLLMEFASYYGVSDAYAKLRYLSYIMDVATPTEDCLVLVHDLLVPVVKSRLENTLSRQEKRILGEVEEQVEQILALVFENYKSLDESSSSGLINVMRPATGVPAPALVPAVKLFSLLHDILSPEVQLSLCSYFQAAAKKRSRRHMSETDEFVAANNNENDVVALSTAYSKMKTLCVNVRNEVYTDIEIHEQHVLPSFIDLPNITASIYSVELCSRLQAFLVACPPSGPSPPVADLVIAAADFQKDLACWNISPMKGGVDAKELFHLYIILWIKDKRNILLESCKLDKVKWSGVTTQHCTTPFVDDMYDRLKDTLNEYEIIICRWPEYTFVLENAVADVEKAVIEALERQYADVLAPLKDSMTPKKFGLKYVQKLAKRNSLCPYNVPEEVGIFLNTMKRLLDVLRPKIETQLKSWVACIPSGGSSVAGERLSEVTVMLRAKFRNYLQAIVEKLADNTRLQGVTKLKKIIQDTKDAVGESEIRERMQPLKALLTDTICHLHNVVESHVFIALCRGYWDRMGQDVLNFLENRKENRSWYKGSRVTVAILDDTFASQMQRLKGHALQEKDLEAPRSVMEVRSMLCKDAPNHKDSNYFYY